MTRFHSTMGRISIFFLFAMFAINSSAQTPASDKLGADAPPIYKPPVRGAPASRIGGGSRSVGTGLPRVYVLAPQDIGFTTKGKPDLFWFVSEPTEAKVILTLYTDDPNKPLLEEALKPVTAPGVQRVRLAEYGLELQPQVEYRWRISLINDAANRQARAIAGAAIQRTDSWPKLQARLQNGGALERAHVYAEEGLWYDAMEMMSESASGNPKARRQRAALLDQVGLTEASQFEAANK